MRSLAEAWSCDASNVTWMVDRLEKKGLAERLSKAGDRRVKLIALTPAGITAKVALQAGIYDPPPELLALPRSALEALREAGANLPRLRAGERPQEPIRGEKMASARPAEHAKGGRTRRDRGPARS